jgi:hypothetical protein
VNTENLKVESRNEILLNTMLKHVQVGEIISQVDGDFFVLTKTFIDTPEGFEIEIALAQKTIKSSPFINYGEMLELITQGDVLNMDNRIRKVVKKVFNQSGDKYSPMLYLGPVKV